MKKGIIVIGLLMGLMISVQTTQARESSTSYIVEAEFKSKIDSIIQQNRLLMMEIQGNILNREDGKKRYKKLEEDNYKLSEISRAYILKKVSKYKMKEWYYSFAELKTAYELWTLFD